jgi:hypothetical protein
MSTGKQLYDHASYGMRLRKEFTATNPNTSVNVVTRWYPPGAIKIVKFGYRMNVICAGTKLDLSLNKGASASVVATVHVSTTQAAWTVASKESLTQVVGAGSFIAVIADGTSDSGSLVPFIDYVRLYGSQWDTTA